MSNNSVLLSVIVCTYNRAELLKNCLRSLHKQTVGRNLYEIIVVDNNCTDDTQKIVKSFAGNRIAIRLVSGKMQGLGRARNRGWKEALGKYVAYIDDDAIAKCDWVKQIILFIKHHPRINAFGGPYDRYCLTTIPPWLPDNYFTLNLGNKIKILNLKNEWISGSNMIFSKSILEKYNGFVTNLGMKGDKILYGEETELLLRLKKNNEPIYYVPKIRVKHLVAERKLHVWWLLQNDYWHGLSYSLLRKPKFNFLKSAISFIIALLLIPIFLIDITKGVIKRRLYYGISNIFLSLGQVVGSIYNLNIKLFYH